MGARHEDLRAATGRQHLDDVGLDAVAAFVALAGNLLFLGKERLGTAEVYDPAGTVASLDNAGNDLALSVLVFLVDDLLLGVAHALDEHLFGGLGGDAAEILDRQLEAHLVFKGHVGVDGPGIGQTNFRRRIGHVIVFHHDLELVHLDLALFVVVADLDIEILAIFADDRRAHGLFQGVDQQIAINAPVLADLIDGFFQFRHARHPAKHLQQYYKPEQRRLDQAHRDQPPVLHSKAHQLAFR